MKQAIRSMAVAGFLVLGGLSNAAFGAPIQINGLFSGNECGGPGGFANCYATQTGTQQGLPTDPLASPTVYKRNSDGSQDFGSFSSVNGSEFSITFTGGATNTLSFTYTPGANDPDLHYFVVFQANSFVLFYDATPITAGSLALSTYFPNNPGFSHITFFDTGRSVPEPTSSALLLAALFGLGVVRRARRRV